MQNFLLDYAKLSTEFFGVHPIDRAHIGTDNAEAFSYKFVMDNYLNDSVFHDVRILITGSDLGYNVYPLRAESAGIAAIMSSILEPLVKYDDTRFDLRRVLTTLGVQWAKGHEGARVLCWTRMSDRIAKRPKQEIKLGRFLTRIFDPAMHKFVERLCDSLKKVYDPKLAAANLVFDSGTNCAAFRTAYTAPVYSGMSTLAGSSGFSSLSSSCMQKPKNWFGTGDSPAIAYGSGDFIQLSVWHKVTGDLCARAVMTQDGTQLAPIYAAWDGAGKFLIHMIKVEFELDVDDMGDSFDGYTLAAIETDSGGYHMPYLDCRTNIEFTDNAFSICHYGNEETDTSGRVYGEAPERCDECGAQVDECESTYVESTEETVCSHCLNYYYFNSEHSNEYFRDSESVDVIGSYGTEQWADHEAAADAWWSDYLDSYIETDYATITECGAILDNDNPDLVTFAGLNYLEDSDELSDAQAESLVGGILALLEYLRANPLLPFIMVKQCAPMPAPDTLNIDTIEFDAI